MTSVTANINTLTTRLGKHGMSEVVFLFFFLLLSNEVVLVFKVVHVLHECFSDFLRKEDYQEVPSGDARAWKILRKTVP